MLSNFYPLDLPNETCVALAKPTIKPHQKLNWKSNISLFRHGYYKCMCEDFLIGYIGPPIVFMVECEAVHKIWRRSPIS